MCQAQRKKNLLITKKINKFRKINSDKFSFFSTQLCYKYFKTEREKRLLNYYFSENISSNDPKIVVTSHLQYILILKFFHCVLNQN